MTIIHYYFFFFFFNDPATTEIYPLSLHDALPILNAPLEEPANPNLTMNPSKAPWYFLGLQEMLVYFDPWIAGVVMPSIIMIGLMVFPYVDSNPLGNGYYTLRQRRFAVNMFS